MENPFRAFFLVLKENFEKNPFLYYLAHTRYNKGTNNSRVMSDIQNTIIYLMFLNGILFLNLNFIAYSLIFPRSPGSKRLGYTLIITALSAFFAQQEFRALVSLGFDSQNATNVLLGGFIIPLFLVSLVYYRIRRNKGETKASSLKIHDKNH